MYRGAKTRIMTTINKMYVNEKVSVSWYTLFRKATEFERKAKFVWSKDGKGFPKLLEGVKTCLIKSENDIHALMDVTDQIPMNVGVNETH